MTAQALASKFRRALRNETGATFTLEQMRELSSYGVLPMILQKEAEELCPDVQMNSGSETTGSPSGEMANHRISGRSPTTRTSRGPLSIAALSAGL